MSNSNISKGYNNINPYDFQTDEPKKVIKIVDDNTYTSNITMAINNFPLYSPIANTEPDTEIVTTLPDEQSNLDNNMGQDMMKITFEKIWENLSSYDSTYNFIDEENNILQRVVTISDTQQITITTDMTDPNRNIDTLSGHVPTGVKLVRTTVYNEDSTSAIRTYTTINE